MAKHSTMTSGTVDQSSLMASAALSISVGLLAFSVGASGMMALGLFGFTAVASFLGLPYLMRPQALPNATSTQSTRKTTNDKKPRHRRRLPPTPTPIVDAHRMSVVMTRDKLPTVVERLYTYLKAAGFQVFVTKGLSLDEQMTIPLPERRGFFSLPILFHQDDAEKPIVFYFHPAKKKEQEVHPLIGRLREVLARFFTDTLYVPSAEDEGYFDGMTLYRWDDLSHQWQRTLPNDFLKQEGTPTERALQATEDAYLDASNEWLFNGVIHSLSSFRSKVQTRARVVQFDTRDSIKQISPNLSSSSTTSTVDRTNDPFLEEGHPTLATLELAAETAMKQNTFS